MEIGQFVRVRDSVWKIAGLTNLNDNRLLIELLPISERGADRLSVVVPPERIEQVEPPDLALKKNLFGPIGPWYLKHDIVASSCIRESDSLGGCRFGRVALEAYQIAPVLRILSTPKARLLIADDVGLGKTIEAGLCLLELKARGRAESILIVVPPGLILQWQDEMKDKFNLDFVRIENAMALDRVQMRLPAGANPWEYLPHVITSIDYLKKKEVMERALKRHWDVIVVDEAHALSESGSQNYPYRTARTRLGEGLRDACTSFLLLTATPHNGYSHSFRSLIELVEPTAATLWGNPEKVRERVERTMIRRLKIQITKKGKDGKPVPAFPEREVESIKVPLSDKELEFFKKVSNYCSKTAVSAKGEENQELVTFAMQIIKKRMLSSRKALQETIEHRLSALKSDKYVEEPPQKAELRDLQSDLPLTEATHERISRRILRSAIPRETRRRNSEKRALSTLKKDLAKLPEVDPKIKHLIDHLKEEVLPEEGEKAIIFTEYLDTLWSIRDALDSEPEFKGTYEILRGGFSLKKRAAVQARFEKPEIRFLLATDAASEGLNLQRFCRRIIHFELPWNPNRLEQRNGRVDRYGQERQPIIRYFYFPQSPEDEILHLVLARKIEEMQSDRISTPDTLGILTGLELDKELTEIDATTYDEPKRRRLLQVIKDRTSEYIKNVRPLLPQHSFTENERERVEQILQSADPILGDDRKLEDLMLSRLGNRAKQNGAEGIYSIEVPRELKGPGVEPFYKRATFRRTVAIKFLPSEMEFINILHPLFQAVRRESFLALVQPGAISQPDVRRRLAARRSCHVTKPCILFTFLASLKDGNDRPIEESLLSMAVTEEGSILPDNQLQELLQGKEESPGEVRWDEIESAFSGRFETLRDTACKEVFSRIRDLKEEVLGKRETQAGILIKDLESYSKDRIKEIDKEERETRFGVGEQMLMFRQQATGFQAKRERVNTYVAKRKEEIAKFSSIRDPDPPISLGALFVFPE